MLKKPVIWVASLGMFAVVILAILNLFEMRFERGDIYSPYSSLRADPLGVSVLFEAWDRLPGCRSVRYYEAEFDSNEREPAALLVLGATPGLLLSVGDREFANMDRFISNGGRLIVGFAPEKTDDPTPIPKKDPGLRQKKSVKPLKRASVPDKAEKKKASISLETRWGYRVEHRPLAMKDDETPVLLTAVPTTEAVGLVDSLAVRTSLYFSDLTNSWSVLYQSRQQPVLIERPWGKGRIILLADSFWLSNEAMRKERNSPLITHLLGDSRVAIFDEAHLGMVASHGTAELMRKYRLHGLFAGLAVLAIGYIWRSSMSLVPPWEESVAEGGLVVAGRDSGAAFSNLLRRGVPFSTLIETCVGEWRKTSRAPGVPSSQIARVDAVLREHQSLSPSQRRPIETYREIAKILERHFNKASESKSMRNFQS